MPDQNLYKQQSIERDNFEEVWTGNYIFGNDTTKIVEVNVKHYEKCSRSVVCGSEKRKFWPPLPIHWCGGVAEVEEIIYSNVLENIGIDKV